MLELHQVLQVKMGLCFTESYICGLMLCRNINLTETKLLRVAVQNLCAYVQFAVKIHNGMQKNNRCSCRLFATDASAAQTQQRSAGLRTVCSRLYSRRPFKCLSLFASHTRPVKIEALRCR